MSSAEKKKGSCILYYHVKASSGELHYLRLLLLHVRGEYATSFEDLQRAASAECVPSFQQLARELGLLHDDCETCSMLAEAAHTLTSTTKLCELLAETFVWLEVSDHIAVWDNFLHLMAAHHASYDPSQLYVLVDEILHSYALSLSQFGIVESAASTSSATQCWAAREYDAELRSPSEQLHERAQFDLLTLNSDQQLIFDAVCALTDGPFDPDAANVIFADGPAGCGKTYLYRKVLHYVRSTGRIALAVAMSGIAALLLPGGRTAHSRFRLPVPLPSEGCSCNIKAQSASARLIREAAVVVWDLSSIDWPTFEFQLLKYKIKPMRV